MIIITIIVISLSSIVYFQSPVGNGLRWDKPGNNQLLHKPHYPLLCQQEVQKLLQGIIPTDNTWI